MQRMSRSIIAAILLGGLACLAAPPSIFVPAAASPVTGSAAPVIVQGRDLASAVAAVREAGGEITHELGIIQAVGARLTAEQRAELAASDDVTQLYDDRAVRVASGKLMRDNFDGLAYDGDAGNTYWSGDWQELGETDGAGSGRVQIVSAAECASGGCLRLGGGGVSLNGRGLWREADLTGATSATLSFSYRRVSDSGLSSAGVPSMAAAKGPMVRTPHPVVEATTQAGAAAVTAAPKAPKATAAVTVQASGDGGATWSTVGLYHLQGDDGGQILQSFNISAFIAADTRIRFLGSVVEPPAPSISTTSTSPLRATKSIRLLS